MRASRSTLAALALALLSPLAAAQTVTVTLCADTIDIDPFSATVADLPGPDGEVSLSEALIATNNTPGHQTIEFEIPTSNWQLQFLFPGRAVLTSLTGFYWRALDEVTIDATTQTAFTGDTNPDGAEVVLYQDSLWVSGGNSVVTGFDSSSLSIGSDTLVVGNTGSTNIDVGGDRNTIRGNVGGTIKIDRADNNDVQGNVVQRIRVLGGGPSQPTANNRIGGPGLADRNFITGYGTYNSEGLPAGSAVQLSYTQGTLLENNWIGTTTDGLGQGNTACTMGIELRSFNQDVTIRNNRVAGILAPGKFKYAGTLWGWAVYFWGDTFDVELAGNTVGLDVNDQPVLGSVWGVNVDNFAGYTVTGVELVDNVIAGHLFNGLRVAPTASMRVSGTEIWANGWLGIDLIGADFASGVTPNDPLDADVGGNGLQNYPVLASASNMGNALRVTGTLRSSPLDLFTVELFASSSCDPSGFGQAETFLGSASVTTDANGDAVFDVTLPVAAPSGWQLTATATLEPLGLTSELSACEPVLDLYCQQDLGFGGPGASLLSLCGGDLSAGTTAELRLANATPDRLAVLAIGPTLDPTPILGGTLVPFPPAASRVYMTDGSGALSVPGIPGGLGPRTLYVQLAYSDESLPGRWGISNALQVELLP